MSPPSSYAQRRREFDNAIDYYEMQQPGLGVRFANAVQRVFDHLAKLPRGPRGRSPRQTPSPRSPSFRMSCIIETLLLCLSFSP